MDCGENGHSGYYVSGPSSDFRGCEAPRFKSDDELFVDAWLSTVDKIDCNPKRGAKVQTASIACVKSDLKRCADVLGKLEDAHRALKQDLVTMSSEEWRKGTIEIGALRDELSGVMTRFQNPDLLRVLKSKIRKRARRRANQRDRRSLMADRKSREHDELAATHERIDRWLEGMRESVERSKAEENMKKDADCVLSEVTKKKSDARRQLSLISALDRLRDVREQAAVQRGERSCAEDRAAFKKAAEKLGEMWENALKTYAKEEQGLRIMLEQSVPDGPRTSFGKEKQTSHAWERVLFGDTYVPATPVFWGLTSAERDVETFIAIRKSWDTFLTPSEDGSKIPVGWVLPTAKADESWTRYLET